MIVAMVLTVGLGVSLGTAFALTADGAPCGELSGFPGFLQAVHLMAVGDCNVNPNGTCKNSATCHVQTPSGKKTGKCVSGAKSCSCVVN